MVRILCVLILLIGFHANAQEDYKVMAQETCDCIVKKDMQTATKKSIEMALGLCMLEALQHHKVDIDISDGAAMQRFGEKIGIQMAPLCPEVFEFLTEEIAQSNESVPEVMTMSGKIKSLEDGDFLFITLREESGKDTRLIWLRYFKGSDEYLKNPRKLVGKNVTLKYQSIECYLPKAKGYYDYKEIIEMEVK